MYESHISFTLDTICPWTYLAKKRLDKALEQFRASPGADHVRFTVQYLPYQLYPDMANEPQDKYDWYKITKYENSDDKMEKYITLMSSYGRSEDIDFNFRGTISNTINAHRLIQHFQENMGPQTTDAIVNSLYKAYFTASADPTSLSTLLGAAVSGGVPNAEAEAFIADEMDFLSETRMLIREQASNGIDSVPHILVEGKKRDFTLEGAKETKEYLKALEDVTREAA